MGVKVGAQRYGDLAAVGRSPGNHQSGTGCALSRRVEQREGLCLARNGDAVKSARGTPAGHTSRGSG